LHAIQFNTFTITLKPTGGRRKSNTITKINKCSKLTDDDKN
jgi:hypothetical protein